MNYKVDHISFIKVILLAFLILYGVNINVYAESLLNKPRSDLKLSTRVAGKEITSSPIDVTFLSVNLPCGISVYGNGYFNTIPYPNGTGTASGTGYYCFGDGGDYYVQLNFDGTGNVRVITPEADNSTERGSFGYLFTEGVISKTGDVAMYGMWYNLTNSYGFNTKGVNVFALKFTTRKNYDSGWIPVFKVICPPDFPNFDPSSGDCY